MSESTLNYGDRQLFRLSMPRWLQYAPTWMLLIILFLPPALTFLYHFFLPWEILKPRYSSIFLGSLLSLPCISSFLFLFAAVRARQRRVFALVQILIVLISIPLLCIAPSSYAEWPSSPILKRRELASQRIARVYNACIDYAASHTDVQGSHLPPNLALLIASHAISPEDLIDPSSFTAPMIPPPGLAASDWPKIAAEVDAHSDFAYYGADVVLPYMASPESNRFTLLYSKVRHFRAGTLVAPNTFVLDSDLATLWKDSNAAREKIFLPPLTFGGPPPAPPSPTAYLLKSPPPTDLKSASYRIRIQHMAAIENAIQNYTVEHEGHFPPHLATLIAGHTIEPEDLVYPGSATTPLGNDLSNTTENSWPMLAKDVEAHCDFIYLGGGFEDAAALLKWKTNPSPPIHQTLLFYTKPIHPAVWAEGFSFPQEPRGNYQMLFVSIPYAIRLANETRTHFGIPRALPNVVPEITIPMAPIAGAPAAADTDSLNREISRRNAMVLAAAHLRFEYSLSQRDIDSYEWQGLLAGRYILPRHLHDPALQTPLADAHDADFPKFEDDLNGTQSKQWRSASTARYIDMHSDYIFLFAQVKLTSDMKQVLLYSKNTYNNTGRICAFADGSAAFVPGFLIP